MNTAANKPVEIVINPEPYRWYSVDEAMPRIGSDVVVFMPGAYIGIDVQACYNDGKWKPTWADGWNKGQRFEITHWMHVPRPKEDKQK